MVSPWQPNGTLSVYVKDKPSVDKLILTKPPHLAQRIYFRDEISVEELKNRGIEIWEADEALRGDRARLPRIDEEDDAGLIKKSNATSLNSVEVRSIWSPVRVL